MNSYDESKEANLRDDTAAAMSYLREQMGEGWRVSLTAKSERRWEAQAWTPLGHPVSCVVVSSEGPDPMSAARACVEARDAAFPASTRAWAQRAEEQARAALRELDEERAHADRLAEALASAAKEVRRLLPHCGALYKALDIICDSVAAHDARRGKEGA